MPTCVTEPAASAAAEADVAAAVQDAIADLRALFVERSLASIGTIRRFVASRGAAGNDRDARDEAVMLAHRLRGGGGSFGLPAISRMGDALETGLRNDAEAGHLHNLLCSLDLELKALQASR